jgi:hypothetical protein
MKRATVGGLDAPAGIPQGLRPGGAIDHTRLRTSQAGWVLCAFSLSILFLQSERESSLAEISPFAIRKIPHQISA